MKPECIEDGCDRPHFARGLCQTHYQSWLYRMRKTGTSLPALSPRQPICCSVDGCDRPQKGKGLCNAHYQASRRHMGKTGTSLRFCSVDGCDRPHNAKGLCNRHHARLLRNGHPTFEKQRQYPPRGICSVDGCDRAHQAKGLCQSHYWFTKKNPGQPLAPFKPVARRARLYVAMMLDVRDRSTGCWDDWPHASESRLQRPTVGVPMLRKSIPVKSIPVARYVRFLEDGEWPIFACHHCDNPRCWNPDHIYAGTPASNTADRDARGRAHWQIAARAEDAAS